MTHTKQAHTPTPEQIAAVRRLQTYDRLREQNARLVAALREFRQAYLVPRHAPSFDADRNFALMIANQVASALLAEIDKE